MCLKKCKSFVCFVESCAIPLRWMCFSVRMWASRFLNRCRNWIVGGGSGLGGKIDVRLSNAYSDRPILLEELRIWLFGRIGRRISDSLEHKFWQCLSRHYHSKRWKILVAQLEPESWMQPDLEFYRAIELGQDDILLGSESFKKERTPILSGYP